MKMMAVLMIFTLLVLACIWENLGPSAISGHIVKFWFCLHSLLIFRPRFNFNFYLSSLGLCNGETGHQLSVQNLTQREERIELTLGNASHMGLCRCSNLFTSGGFLSGRHRLGNGTHEKYGNGTCEKSFVAHEKYVKTSNP